MNRSASGPLPGPEAIATARLDLSPLRPEHAEAMAAVLGDQRLHTFVGGTAPTPPRLRARYERLAAGSPDPAVSWCNWVVGLRVEGCLVGTVQATVTHEPAEPVAAEAAAGPRADSLVAEIAWVTGTDWQGRGIATEAACGLVAWLARQGVRTVRAHIHPDHHASAAVAAAVGLVPTDHRQDGETRWHGRL